MQVLAGNLCWRERSPASSWLCHTKASPVPTDWHQVHRDAPSYHTSAAVQSSKGGCVRSLLLQPGGTHCSIADHLVLTPPVSSVLPQSRSRLWGSPDPFLQSASSLSSFLPWGYYVVISVTVIFLLCLRKLSVLAKEYISKKVFHLWKQASHRRSESV